MNGAALSRRQWIELVALINAGISLAVGSVAFRWLVPRLDVPLELHHLQYRVGFIFLALLLLLWMNSNTKMGRIVLTFSSLSLGLGLIVPPSFDYFLLAEGLLYLVAALAGGVLYYRFYDPSNTTVIVLVLLFSLEFYLYGMWYVWRAWRETGIIWTWVGFGLLTLIIIIYYHALGYEIRKVHDGTRTARYLGKVL